MGYFVKCDCIEELKKRYRELCFKFHPDVSREANAGEIMKMINNEYDELFARLKNVFKNSKGEIYEDKKPVNESPEEFRDIISALINLQGINVELIGRWIWVTGETKAHKEILKKLNFKWCVKKKAWSWHRPEDYCHSRKNSSLDDIRAKYGVTKYNGNSKNDLRELAG